MDTLDGLLDIVEKQQTKIDSYQALFAGLEQRLESAIGAGQLTPSQKMRMAALFKSVADNSAEIDAAIQANTAPTDAAPADPAPVPVDETGQQG